MPKITVTHDGKAVTSYEVAAILHSTPHRVGRRLARMKRRNPKLEEVTVERLIELTNKHKVKNAE